MITSAEIDWGHGGIRLRKEPLPASRVVQIAAPDTSLMAGSGDYRDLTIADLADQNAALRERLKESEQREAELRSWGRVYRDIAQRATAMLARVTYERDHKERKIRQLMGVEPYSGDEDQEQDDAAA